MASRSPDQLAVMRYAILLWRYSSLIDGGGEKALVIIQEIDIWGWSVQIIEKLVCT